MAANTRAQASLRTRLNVETLEGRALPAPLIAQPTIDSSHVAAQTSTVNPGSSQTVARVVSRIFVNDEMVMKVRGRPNFAGIGSAASGDQNGHIERGGTTIFVNGQAVGTFEGPPQITRTVAFVRNGHGELVKVVSFHITGTPYIAPTADAATTWHTQSIGGVWVG